MTHNPSPVSIFTVLAFCATALAQDITVSKDSIRVYNSIMSSAADQVTFTSSSSAAIRLDSAFVLVAEMDTAGLTWVLQHKMMQIEWKGNTGSTQLFLWKMDSSGVNKYRMTKQEFIPPTDTPLSFSAAGTTNKMFFLEIGYCFICDMLPVYPKYFKGSMQLYFSNGQVLEIKLWSQDLRVGVKAKSSFRQLLTVNNKLSSAVKAYTMNGKNITAEVIKGSYFQRPGIIVVKITENGRSYYLKELLAR